MSSTPRKLNSLIFIIVALLLLGGTYFYFSIFHKDALEKFYLKVDVIGITQIGKAELDRTSEIMNLDLPLSQREALINKTIFFGANKQMVILALGKPESQNATPGTSQEVWVYYFDDYTRPTYLYFTGDKLVSAEKANN